MFKNREEAGVELAGLLKVYKGNDVIVYAIPRGGVVVGDVIAAHLNCPLDVILSKKIGHPHNSELAVGSVCLDELIITYDEGIPDEYIEKEGNKLRAVLAKKYEKLKQYLPAEDCKGKVAVIVDDGIATGSTIHASVTSLRKKGPRKIVVAVPVAPPKTIRELRKNADEVICPLQPENFYAVGQFYQNFKAISDEDVIRILEKASRRMWCKEIK